MITSILLIFSFQNIIYGMLDDTIECGLPHWRNTGFLFTQFLCFPLLAFRREFDVIKYLFPLLLIWDFFIINLSSQLKLHHIVCILGHSIAYITKDDIEKYIFAVTMLELGSGAYNMYCGSFIHKGLLVPLMMLSNIIAIFTCWMWCKGKNIWIQSFVFVTTYILTVERQVSVSLKE